ncbi:MAG: flavin reductase family protein [Planctomycetota bacterium]
MGERAAIEGLGDAADVLGLLPRGSFVMTSAFEGTRAGLRLRAVQQCADEPLLVSVAARKGHRIDPLIRDSRGFAVCFVAPDDRLIERKFAEESHVAPAPVASGGAGGGAGGVTHAGVEEEPDPFDSLPTITLATGSPILTRSIAAIDCEVVRHFDLEADHELFVGQVLAAKVFRAAGG